MVDAKIIKKLREQTGAGVMDIKKALAESNGDEQKALEILKEIGLKIAKKKQGERTASEGSVAAYIHNNGKIAVLVVLNCETDFVAKNEEFKSLAYEIAMQVAAMNPSDVPELLSQSSIKDGSQTIQEVINSATAKLGEKIEIREFVRLVV